jgi:hypothetical protein
VSNRKSPARRPDSNRFRRDFDPHKLTLADLIAARDAYHTHLANLPNVAGTALGLYRIRQRDPDYKRDSPNWTRFSAARARTLGNSAVQRWSWPSVLVFVDEWATRNQQRDKTDEMVPPWLHLPDGRKIPTCVIHAPRQPQPQFSPLQLAFPSGLYGGGYPPSSAASCAGSASAWKLLRARFRSTRCIRVGPVSARASTSMRACSSSMISRCGLRRSTASDDSASRSTSTSIRSPSTSSAVP